MALIFRFSTVLAYAFVLSTTCASAENLAQPVRHEKPAAEGLGWVNLNHPQGRYIYGTESDGRIKTPTITFGRVERQDYQLFSWEEEQALWLLLQDKLTAAEPEKKTAFVKAHSQRNLKWPRVIVKDQEVCVPRIEKAEDDDWKDHLTCLMVGGLK